MHRRTLLIQGGAAAVRPLLGGGCAASRAAGASSRAAFSRVRPGDAAWPGAQDWDELRRRVEGRLIEVRVPPEFLEHVRNPFYLGDEVALTQNLGWVDAWTSRPSVYAVAARTTADVVAAVNFARKHRLRLVVKGGGHSYLGTSNAADSLLLWTRHMNAVSLHDAFVARGCASSQRPVPAVTVEAGALWMQVYDAVTTKAGRYVQGGGCTTVGVAGLIQSGGFGSFSKRYGLACAGLLEAEIVTADGRTRVVNACTDPDLFWALKGGGGGSFGALTRLTLATRELPEFFGSVTATLSASSDAAYRRLIGRVIAFYAENLFDPHWGEQLVFRGGNALEIRTAFQGLSREQAERVWSPFFGWVRGVAGDVTIAAGPRIVAVPARRLWDASLLRQVAGLIVPDDRPGASEASFAWAGDAAQAGQVLHGYQSAWLPAALLHRGSRERLADALFAATRHWSVSLHLNKGLAGAPRDARAAARETAMNPAVVDAFALAIAAASGPPAYPGIVGREPDLAAARAHAAAIGRAMSELRRLAPEVGSYVSESDFFEPDWQRSYWGANYPRLLAIKDPYDPDGLFIVHHGVGSERWSPDGFTRR